MCAVTVEVFGISGFYADIVVNTLFTVLPTLGFVINSDIFRELPQYSVKIIIEFLRFAHLPKRVLLDHPTSSMP